MIDVRGNPDPGAPRFPGLALRSVHESVTGSWQKEMRQIAPVNCDRYFRVHHFSMM